MDRDDLARMLERDGAAFAACRRAVLAGAQFWVTDGTQPASTLVSLYARRDRRTRQRGIPTVGFADAVAELDARGDDLVRIGAVDEDEPPYHFQLFLDEHATTVVACLGVDQRWKAQRHATEPATTDATSLVHHEPPDPR